MTHEPFSPSKNAAVPSLRNNDPWKLLLADDAPDMRNVINMVLNTMAPEGRKLEVHQAERGDEVIAFIAENPDTAVILLDLKMESDSSGLDAVTAIRGELGNWWTRIIVMTGGYEGGTYKTLMQDYPVNGLIEKGSGQLDGVQINVIAACRSYADICRAASPL